MTAKQSTLNKLTALRAGAEANPGEADRAILRESGNILMELSSPSYRDLGTGNPTAMAQEIIHRIRLLSEVPTLPKLDAVILSVQELADA